MAERTTHLRVREGTLAAMRQLVEEMAESVRRGRGKRFWGDGPLTLAGLVEELVSRELAHRERSRKASREKKKTEVWSVPTDSPPVPLVPVTDLGGEALEVTVREMEDWFKEFERVEKSGR